MGDGRGAGLGTAMWRLIKVLAALVLIAGVALVAYAYLGPVFFADDFAPPARQVTVPVDLDLGR